MTDDKDYEAYLWGLAVINLRSHGDFEAADRVLHHARFVKRGRLPAAGLLKAPEPERIVA